jgi:hypothetical protein
MVWIKRGFLALVLLLVLLSLGRSIRRSLASAQTRITWNIEEMIEGFSDGRVRPVLRHVSPEFRDESSGADREDLHRALLHLFLTEKDPETKAFRLRAELLAEDLEIVPDPVDPERARVRLHVRILDPLEGAPTVYWDAKASCDWALEDGRWKLTRSAGVNHRDRR